MDPFNHDIFLSDFDLGNNKFKDKTLVLSIFIYKNSTLNQYLLFRLRDKKGFLLIGFDFKNSKIKPIYINEIELILTKMNTLLNSQFINSNEIGLDEAFDKYFEYFRDLKIKKEEFYTFKGLSILLSNLRWVISSTCHIVDANFKLKPSEVTLIFNKPGLLYGEVDNTLYTKNISDYKSIHLFEDLLLSFQLNNENFTVAGTIFQTNEISSKNYKITLSSFIHILNEFNRGYHKSTGLSIHSSMYALLDSYEFNKDNINIEGNKSGYSPYLIIIPIENMRIDALTAGIGDVSFYKTRDALIKYQEFKNHIKEDLIESHFTVAKTIVESENAYEAYLLAKTKIENAINFITIFYKNDRIYNLYNLHNSYNQWKRERIYQNPTLSDYYYAENIIGFERVFEDTRNIYNKQDLEVDESFQLVLNNLAVIEDYYSGPNSDELNDDVLQMLNALKWLKRSWEAENVEDKIIYINNSLEFLSNNIKVDPLIPKTYRQKFKVEINTILSNQEVFPESYATLIKEKALGNLNNAPLKVKVQKLIEQINSSINEQDLESLWKVRKYRNDLVHGRGIDKVNIKDITISNLIIGEAILNEILRVGD